MIQARRGDIILVACGVYHEADILVKPGVTLWSGTLRPECVTIDASGQGRCLLFSEADSTTQVAGFTLRGGTAHGAGTGGYGGAVFSENSSPRLTHCTLSGNRAVSGGAVYAGGTAGPRFEYCLFVDNESDRDGGAVLWSADEGSLRGCTLRGNDALGSGGALAGRGGALRIEDCLIQDNSAGHSGGGLSLAATTAQISGTVLMGNAGGLGGGALAVHDCSPLLSHCTLHANLADGDATVVRLVRATATFESCLISGSGNPLLESDESSVAISGSNVHVAGTGTWPGVLAAALSKPGNLASDPLYCAPDAGDLHLAPASPCLRPDGERPIGALGTGCGAKFPTDVLD